MMDIKTAGCVNFILENELVRIFGKDGLYRFVDSKINDYKTIIESDITGEEAKKRFIAIHDSLVEYKDELNGKLPF